MVPECSCLQVRTTGSADDIAKPNDDKSTLKIPVVEDDDIDLVDAFPEYFPEYHQK
jgi:hypothetical protein